MKFFLSAIFFVYAYTLNAQEELSRIQVVPSSPLQQRSPHNISLISAQDLSESQSLMQALGSVSGVQCIDSGGIGSRSSVFMRGSEARHTLVTLYGVKLNDTSSIDRQFDLANLRPASFEAAIIKKSPSPVFYGGDAIGGVIEIIP